VEATRTSFWPGLELELNQFSVLASHFANSGVVWHGMANTKTG